MTTATIEQRGTIPMPADITTDEIAAYRDSLTPAARTAWDADSALLQATAAVDAASAEVDGARRVAAEESTPATRSALTRAQRVLAAAQEHEIVTSERYRKAQAAAEPEGEDTAETVVALQRQIRAALLAASVTSGLYGQLAAVSSASGLGQVGPAHADALGQFAIATKALMQHQDAAGWPKRSNDGGRNV